MLLRLASTVAVVSVSVCAFRSCTELKISHRRRPHVFPLKVTETTHFLTKNNNVLEPDTVDECFAIDSLKCQTGADDLPLNLASDVVRSLPSDIRFKYRIRQLLDYKQKNGNYNVPSSYNGLYMWINTQRYEYRMRMQGKDSLLTMERIDLLNAIGFDWRLESSQDGLTPRWMESFRQLQHYAERNGHVRLRKADGKLGQWVQNQRYQYKLYQKGQSPCSMTEKRIELLESAGMIWDLRAKGQTKHDDKWQEHYQKLCEFQKENGHCFVPSQSSSLGRWVANQRMEYQNRLKYNVSALMDTREQLLRDIGFDFESNATSVWRNTAWETNYKKLEAFYEEHNHTLVNTTSSSPLRNWVCWQRQEYRKLQQGKSSILTPERINALERLDFVWNLDPKPRLSWEDRFLQLVDFQSATGHTRVPLEYDATLCKWVKEQRTQHGKYISGVKSRMTAKRKERLEAIGFEWIVPVGRQRTL